MAASVVTVDFAKFLVKKTRVHRAARSHNAMIEPIWSPSPERIARANVTAFIGFVSAGWDKSVVDYKSLHAFSIARLDAFYDALWQFLEIVGDRGAEIVRDADKMMGVTFFPDARINFAENHLRRRDSEIAIVGRTEDGRRRTLTWAELYRDVSRVMQAFEACGLRPGDRIAACMPNGPEAVVAAMATTALGAVWSCCSPDYSAQLIIDRFGQIEPKLFVTADGYRHGGKAFSLREKTEAVVRGLPSVGRVVSVNFAGLGESLPVTGVPVQTWHDFVGPFAPKDISFERFPFDHPVYILYSSGTTGRPKAIVHGAGGSLLQTMKDVVLQTDLGHGELIFFHTSTGWMVWNTMLAALAWRAPILLYEGSPTFPRATALLDIVSEEQVDAVRMVPTLIDVYAKAGVVPADTHDLSKLKCILVGGAPLLDHHYKYVYSKIKKDVHLMSPAGGTDILGTFVTGNPTGPVYAGQIQAPSLGMAVEIFDEDGKSVVHRAGELVCTKPFPSMPRGFWGDDSGERYRESYFSTYPDVWRHGDWAEITPQGGTIIYGRADATLNVNGMRIGTSEIYRPLEAVPDISEAVAVTHKSGDVERIILFVTLATGATFDATREQQIKDTIRRSASARHVPARVIHVADLPRSTNGKPSELAVRDAIHGREVRNRNGLNNPEALALFYDLPELRR